VIFYKIGRLTRSQLDFAKLVEVFDKAGGQFWRATTDEDEQYVYAVALR